MTQYGYALLGLTATVAMLVGVLTFAVLKFVSGARAARRHSHHDGDTSLLAAALQDAMMRLHAQERATSARAAASEQLSSHIVDGIMAGLLVVDLSGRVEILNPAGRRMLECGDSPWGADYRELLADAGPLRDAITETLTTRQAIVRRSVEIPGSGRMLHFGVTVSPVQTDGGKGGAICLFADLTNVVELEEQLRLKEALARVGELTAGIAHEFRNGLATIHGYSRLVAPEALPAPYRPYIEGIRQETEALGQIVTNFLKFARPETVALAPVELEPLARRAGEELQHELPAGTSIQVTGEFDDIQGDEVLLRQVFANLIRNAAEACAGASITPTITIEGSIDHVRRTCRVSVADNGPGIPDSARERVFQPFFTTRSRGTGLGLAIVQKIVVTHNGRVAAGESPSGGARIDMTFPLAAQN